MIPTPSTSIPTRDADDVRTLFLLRIAQGLHAYGTPAHRLEDALTQASSKLGVEGQFFILPTSVQGAFGPLPEQRTFCLRVEPGEVNLEKLVDLDEIIERVTAGAMSCREGIDAVDRVLARRPRFGAAMTLAATTLFAAAGARFFGGGLRECVAGVLVGFVVGACAWASSTHRHAARLLEFTAGFVAALLAITLTEVVGKFSTLTVMLAGMIVLLPGLTLTTAINELATRNLVAGTARLMNAFMIFVAMGFGVGLGRRIGLQFVPLPDAPPAPLPAWTELLALLVGGCALTILFRARLRDAWLILGAGVIAYGGAAIGVRLLGPELGVGLGAFAIGTVGNVFARLTNRPGALTSLPGIIMLVPGGVGFSSFSALLDREVGTAIQSAFSMFLIAAGLVAGLLLANVAAPTRKAL